LFISCLLNYTLNKKKIQLQSKKIKILISEAKLAFIVFGGKRTRRSKKNYFFHYFISHFRNFYFLVDFFFCILLMLDVVGGCGVRSTWIVLKIYTQKSLKKEMQKTNL
jgi:hypothetical protein